MNAMARWVALSALVCLLVASAVRADAFSGAYYDPRTDELVVTMIYQGTNPDHRFSVQWGKCQKLGMSGDVHQIAVEVLDSQWSDAASQNFTKTVRFSLAGLHCRPADVTLRTAPRFYYTVHVP